ncbi:MAG: hypothetical protein V3S46_00990 [Nitrospinota bacterium]
MKSRAVLKIGTAGTFFALCCSPAALAGATGALGLSAWLGLIGNFLFPAMIIIMPLVGYGLYMRKRKLINE